MFIDGKNITKAYNDKVIIENLDIKINKGEAVSIMGAKQSGKTTLAKLIAGAICADEGQILIDNIPADRYTKSVYLSQKSQMIPYRTLLENLLIPLQLRGFSKFEATAIAKEQLKLFNLFAFAHFYPCQLNKSVLRLTAIAQTGLFDADLFVFDEPFCDTSAESKAQIYRYINSKRIEGCTVLLCTNSFEEAEFLTERTHFLPKPQKQAVYIA